MKFISLSALLCAMVVPPSVLGQQRTGFRLPQNASSKSIETTITALITKSATFNGKRVRVFASFHTDGIERSVLMEPNCGEPEPSGANEPQCRRGVVPTESDKEEKDPGNQSLDRALAQGNRSTMDKHITAAFTGIFRCVPSCASPKHFALEIERVENLSVEIKDLKLRLPKRIEQLTDDSVSGPDNALTGELVPSTRMRYLRNTVLMTQGQAPY